MMKWASFFLPVIIGMAWGKTPAPAPALKPEWKLAAEKTLRSSVFGPKLAPEVEAELSRLISEHEETKKILARCAPYHALIEKELRKRGVPLEMEAFPFVESKCVNEHRNHDENGGIWSFSRFTAALYDMSSEIGLDERLDPVKETVAASAFLDEEFRNNRNWPLVVLCYRYGDGAVKEVRLKLKTSDPIRLQRALSDERYYEQIVAVSILMKNLKLFQTGPF